MTYYVAYTAWRDRTPGSRAGAVHKRVSDANALPIPPADAAEEWWSALSLCGLEVGPQPAPLEWPPGPISKQCPTCRELVARATV